jgi:hypothetical protein
MTKNLQAQIDANWDSAQPIFKALFLRGKSWDKQYADDIKPLLKIQRDLNTKAGQKTPAEVLAELSDEQLASMGVQRIPTTPPPPPVVENKGKGNK